MTFMTVPSKCEKYTNRYKETLLKPKNKIEGSKNNLKNVKAVRGRT
jgi:hypothetical protein